MQQELPKIITDNIEESGYQTPLSEILYIKNLIEEKGYVSILEIGSYKGLTAAALAYLLPSINITSVDKYSFHEKDQKKIVEALSLSDRVRFIVCDGREFFKENIKKEFDFIYIDADKKNIDSYVALSIDVLNKGGTILIDNIFLKGKFSNGGVIEGLASVERARQYLKNRSELKYSEINIFDGLLLIEK